VPWRLSDRHVSVVLSVHERAHFGVPPSPPQAGYLDELVWCAHGASGYE